jgi:hypothetical protein
MDKIGVFYPNYEDFNSDESELNLDSISGWGASNVFSFFFSVLEFL